MHVFVLSDLHLSFSTPTKTMEIFGKIWKNYEKKIENNWKKNITKDDLVLIPGDISWAIKLKDALIDLEWIHNLPGKKVIIKGNHDYWWPSQEKLKKALPPSVFLFKTQLSVLKIYRLQELDFGIAKIIILMNILISSQIRKKKKIKKNKSKRICLKRSF